MKRLEGFQKRYLRGLAHGMKPVVLVGQKGLTHSLAVSIEEALDAHELIKVRFLDLKEKAGKKALGEAIEERSGSEMVGMTGHTAIFFRQQADPEKRRIRLPERKQ